MGDNLQTCRLSDAQPACPSAPGGTPPSSRQSADWVRSGSCWCACASRREPLRQKEAEVGPPIRCCPPSLWSPGNLSNAWSKEWHKKEVTKCGFEKCRTLSGYIKWCRTCSECCLAPSRPIDWVLGPNPTCPPECRRWRNRSAFPGAPPCTDHFSF